MSFWFQLGLKGELRLAASYNNSEVGSWEYLVEPSTTESADGFGEPTRKPWQLDFSVRTAQSGT